MGTRCSGFGGPGAQEVGADNERLLGCQVAAEGVRVAAPVRNCGRGCGSLRCWLSVRRRGSAVLSFCLDWKREGPVFIKVGGSPKSRQAAASHSCSSVFERLSVDFFFFSFFPFWHSPQRLFCVRKPKLFPNTLGTPFKPRARHLRFQQPRLFVGSHD